MYFKSILYGFLIPDQFDHSNNTDTMPLITLLFKTMRVEPKLKK